MNISKVLDMDSKKVSDEEKVAQIATIVSSARKAYGNGESKIAAPEIDTVDGKMGIQFVSNATKLTLVKTEATRIKVAAIEAAKQDGVVANKVIEELIATSPILVNISETSDFSYL